MCVCLRVYVCVCLFHGSSCSKILEVTTAEKKKLRLLKGCDDGPWRRPTWWCEREPTGRILGVHPMDDV